MKTKNSRYIELAEKYYLGNKQRNPNVEQLYGWLDLFVIPCVSMSKEDQKELLDGLQQMLNKHNQQTKIEF